jgi:hypothetical protein
MATRDELVAAIAERYSRADRTERGRILDEFGAVTGFHRKHAMRYCGMGNQTGVWGHDLDAGSTMRRRGKR